MRAPHNKKRIISMSACVSVGGGKRTTPEELIAYADADSTSKKKHNLVFSPWGRTNMVNMNADDDEGSFVCGEAGDAHFCVREALEFPGVRLIAILSNRYEKYDAYSQFSERLRGFYDVPRQLLYEKKDISYDAVGLVWSSVGSNMSPAVLHANVLCLDMETNEEMAYSALTDEDVCDMKNLLSRLVEDVASTATEEKARHRHIWVRYLRRCMEHGWAIPRLSDDDGGAQLADADSVAAHVAKLTEIFTVSRSAYPGAIEEAYALESKELLRCFIAPCFLPLFRLHLENGAAQYSSASEMEALYEKLNGTFARPPGPKAKYAGARDLLERFCSSRPKSRKGSGINACEEGLLLMEKKKQKVV